MPRIIFKCPYLKGGSPAVMAHLKNLVGYIATRDGAEKIDPGNTRLAATNKQKELVAQLVQSFPESTELFEYEDYRWLELAASCAKVPIRYEADQIKQRQKEEQAQRGAGPVME